MVLVIPQNPRGSPHYGPAQVADAKVEHDLAQVHRKVLPGVLDGTRREAASVGMVAQILVCVGVRL